MDADAGEVVALPDPFVEVSFPAWPAPTRTVKAIAVAAPRSWASPRQGAAMGLAAAALVGVPVACALLGLLALVALGSLVLLAPEAALGLAWTAWRCDRRLAVPPVPGPGRPRLRIVAG